jgi:uncharacterized membrane protein
MGSGGVTKGLISACAVKAMGGAMLARLMPQTAEERAAVAAAGLDCKRIYTCDDLASGRQIFFAATGITDGVSLSGVKYLGNEGHTESLVLRCETGTRRVIWQLITSFITVGIFLGLRQGFSIHIAPGDLAPILLLGIVNTGIGCYFYFSSIGDLPVQTVAICGYLEPLSALLFSAALLGEKLSSVQIVGAGLILGGAAFGELFRQKQLLPKSATP